MVRGIVQTSIDFVVWVVYRFRAIVPTLVNAMRSQSTVLLPRSGSYPCFLHTWTRRSRYNSLWVGISTSQWVNRQRLERRHIACLGLLASNAIRLSTLQAISITLFTSPTQSLTTTWNDLYVTICIIMIAYFVQLAKLSDLSNKKLWSEVSLSTKKVEEGIRHFMFGVATCSIKKFCYRRIYGTYK